MTTDISEVQARLEKAVSYWSDPSGETVTVDAADLRALLDAYAEGMSAMNFYCDSAQYLQARASKWRALARARREQVRTLKQGLLPGWFKELNDAWFEGFRAGKEKVMRSELAAAREQLDSTYEMIWRYDDKLKEERFFHNETKAELAAEKAAHVEAKARIERLEMLLKSTETQFNHLLSKQIKNENQ